MDIKDSNSLRINVISISDTATLHLSGHFSFDAHREFKAAYKNQLKNTTIAAIVVNFAEVKYLDSAALGMLLVLRDHVRAANKSLTLSKPSAFAGRAFDIARFNQMFSIC